MLALVKKSETDERTERYQLHPGARPGPGPRPRDPRADAERREAVARQLQGLLLSQDRLPDVPRQQRMSDGE